MKATLKLIKLSKEAVHSLFEIHRDEVQRSWGSMLDQEEALGYLIADALSLDLLPEEARKVGKKAVQVHKKAKETDDKLKGNAAARRTKARRAAEKESTLAEQLDERLAEIDTNCAEQRKAHWAKVVQLPFPEAPLVPTRQRAPDRAPPRARQPTRLEAAEEQLATAEAAKVAAELRQQQAARALAKLRPPGFSGETLTTKSWSYFFNHPLEMPEEEQQRRKVLFDALFAGEWALRTAELEVDCAKRDVTSAHESVTLERKVQEQEKEAAARQRQMEERLEALRLESEREAAETRAA